MLYVLDEPSVGLHPQDTDRLIRVIHQLRDRGNTVVVVEHEEAVIRAADRVVEIGPAAGERGGQVVFEGTPQEMRARAAEPDGRLPRRAARHAYRRQTTHSQPRLDPTQGRSRQQPEEPHRRVSARRALRGDRRERLGQKHARGRYALPRPLPPHAQGRPPSRWTTTTSTATARSTTCCWSIRVPSAARRAPTR